jgi:hypothetical protein
MNAGCKTILNTLMEDVVGLRPIFNLILHKDSGNALNLLRAEGLVNYNPLIGKINYHQLTKLACNYCCVPESRSRCPGPQALASHIACLFIRHVTHTHCAWLAADDLKDLFGIVPPGRHLLESQEDSHRVLRIFLAGPDASIRSILNNLRTYTDRCEQTLPLAKAINARTYGLLVGVDTPWREAGLAKALAKYQQTIPIKTCIVPSIRTLPEAIHELQTRTPQGEETTPTDQPSDDPPGS